jgi:hypothetical protein
MSKSYLVYDAYLCSEPNVDAGDRFTPPWQEVVLKSAYDDLKNEINNYRTHIDMSAYVQKQLEAKLKIAVEALRAQKEEDDHDAFKGPAAFALEQIETDQKAGADDWPPCGVCKKEIENCKCQR